MPRITKIRTKILIILLAVSTIPLLVYGWIASNGFKKEHEKTVFAKLTAVRAAKQKHIEAYFVRIRKELAVYVTNPSVIDAARDFNAAFKRTRELLLKRGDLSNKLREKLKEYYEDEIFSNSNISGLDGELTVDETVDVEKYLPVSPFATYMQTRYLADGAHDSDTKKALPVFGDKTPYDAVHAKYHRTLKNYIENFDLTDLMIIDHITGNILYTVNKKIDFATNLNAGPYKNTGLADLVKRLRGPSNKNETKLVDFSFYNASYTLPASYLGTPIYDGDRQIGILAVQLSIPEIDDVMTGSYKWENEGLRKTGETYLVGPDLKMRSTSRFMIEDPESYYLLMETSGIDSDTIHKLKRLKTTVLIQDAKTTYLEKALEGGIDEVFGSDYRGVRVLKSYSPLAIADLNWAIVAQIDEEEAFLEATSLEFTQIIIISFAVVLIIVLSFIFSHYLTRPIRRFIQQMQLQAAEGVISTVQLVSHDELGLLASSYNTMAQKTIEATEALRVSEEKNATIIDNSVDAIIIVNNAGIIERVNHAFEDMFQYSSNEVVGESVNQLMPEPNHTQHGGFPHICKTTGKNNITEIAREVSGRKKDGTIFPIDLAVREMKLENRIMFTGIIRDISERKEKEGALKHEKLRAELLHVTTQVAADSRTYENALQRCVRAISAMMDFPVGHVYIRSETNDLELVPTNFWFLEDKKTFRPFTEITMITKFRKGKGFPGKIWSSGKPKLIADVNNDKTFIRNKLAKQAVVRGAFGFPVKVNGRLEAVMEFFSDEILSQNPRLLETMKVVADQIGRELARKKAEIQLKDAKDEAVRANQTKSEFLANMSHEIRTPLNAILGFTEVLSSTNINKQQKEYLETIGVSGKSLLRLINDILDLSKVEAGKLELELGPVNVYKLLQEMKQIFSQAAAKKGLELLVEIENDIPESLILDEVRLRQVLFNIVGNAVKFTDNGYVKMCVQRLSLNRFESKLDLVFSVEDTGIGIPKDECQSIFISFQQRKGQSMQKYGGTGLGLAITKKLLQIMNGEIMVSSEEGKGSIFCVKLYDIEAGIMESENVVEQQSKYLKNLSFDAAKLLIVDDIAANRNLIRTYLESYDLTLFEAENGKEAITSVEKHKPHLILMDMKMPVMDGYEAVEKIKSMPSLKNIPIVALTASTLRADLPRVKDLCQSYMRKPVGKKDLIREVMKFLDYTTREEDTIIPETAPLDHKADIKKLQAIDPKILNTFVEVLQTDGMEKWRHIEDTSSINKIMEFTKYVSTLTADCEIPVLKRWQENLQDKAIRFDMKALKTELGKFPELAEAIKKLIQNVSKVEA